MRRQAAHLAQGYCWRVDVCARSFFDPSQNQQGDVVQPIAMTTIHAGHQVVGDSLCPLRGRRLQQSGEGPQSVLKRLHAGLDEPVGIEHDGVS